MAAVHIFTAVSAFKTKCSRDFCCFRLNNVLVWCPGLSSKLSKRCCFSSLLTLLQLQLSINLPGKRCTSSPPPFQVRPTLIPSRGSDVWPQQSTLHVANWANLDGCPGLFTASSFFLLCSEHRKKLLFIKPT